MAVAGMIVLVPGSIMTIYSLRSAIHGIERVPRLRILWIICALFFTIAVAINTCTEWRASRRFMQEGRSVTGYVVETHPEDHDTIIVEYSVFGVDFSARTEGPGTARDYQPGEPIQVYYYASAPAQGFCIEPNWRPDLIIMSWIVAAGVFPVWLIGLASEFELKRRTKPSKASARVAILR